MSLNDWITVISTIIAVTIVSLAVVSWYCKRMELMDLQIRNTQLENELMWGELYEKHLSRTNIPESEPRQSPLAFLIGTLLIIYKLAKR